MRCVAVARSRSLRCLRVDGAWRPCWRSSGIGAPFASICWRGVAHVRAQALRRRTSLAEQFGGPRHVCEISLCDVLGRLASTGASCACYKSMLPAAQLPPTPAAPATGGRARRAGGSRCRRRRRAAGPGDPQVLDEGPIHEAFAEPVALDAKPRVVVDREPPEPINELPPEVQPDGDNVEWIPGYWMWSDEQLDFVWVSGVWRDVPPGRRWVPGHWLAGGQRRGCGSRASGPAPTCRQVQMLPHPPATLEVGPSSPAPGDNFFWIPGCWIWQQRRLRLARRLLVRRPAELGVGARLLLLHARGQHLRERLLGPPAVEPRPAVRPRVVAGAATSASRRGTTGRATR